MAVNSRDLTTLDRVSDSILKSDAEDALTREVFDSSGQFSDEGERGVASASRRVKSYLNRELIVLEKRSLLRSSDWVEKDRTPDDTYVYRLKYFRIREWPVLSVSEDTKVLKDRDIYAPDDTLSQINYFSGYRRQDQVLSDFPSNVQSEFSSEDDIPVLPETIEDVVINLSVHFAMIRISGLVGKEVSQQEIGDFSTTVRRERARDNYEINQLNRINDYRFYT